MEVIKRIFQPSKQSFFLFGPRGTGKSLFVRNFFNNSLYYDLLDYAVCLKFLTRPEHLIEIVEGNPKNKIIVIDEIQKAPVILDTVHRLMERYKHLQFVLTGSSPRKLKNAKVNLLGGRAHYCVLHPFMASELGNSFMIDDALKNGLLPLIWASKNKASSLKSYIGLYIKEEVQQEALVRNIVQFTRFLESISFSHGSILNTSNVSRECGIERKTAEGYINILEDLMLIFRIPVFSKRAKRELISHCKLYFFDAGVFRTLRPSGPFDRHEETDGLALEGMVAQHLRAWVDYGIRKNSLYFWRTKSGVEVDFIIYGEDGLWSIEVKNSDRIRNGDLKSLESFKKDYPVAKQLFLYRGKERLKIKNVLCLSCEEFLKGLNPQVKLSRYLEI